MTYKPEQSNIIDTITFLTQA